MILSLLPYRGKMLLKPGERTPENSRKKRERRGEEGQSGQQLDGSARGCRVRVVLGVAGIRMRMDDLDAVDLMHMVKERRSAVVPCKKHDEQQPDYFTRPVFHAVANLVKSVEFFTLGGSVRSLLRFLPGR